MFLVILCLSNFENIQIWAFWKDQKVPLSVAKKGRTEYLSFHGIKSSEGVFGNAVLLLHTLLHGAKISYLQFFFHHLILFPLFSYFHFFLSLYKTKKR